MAKNTLFAYVLGTEFGIVAGRLIERIESFISSRSWICSNVHSVNQQRSPEDWELGINLDLPDPYQESPGWLEDVEAVVGFCAEQRLELNQDFIVGISDNEAGFSEDIIEIDSEKPNLDYLRKFIGLESPSRESDLASKP